MVDLGLYMNVFSTIKIRVERINKENVGLSMLVHYLGGQPTVRSVMLFGVIGILLFCIPLLITS